MPIRTPGDMRRAMRPAAAAVARPPQLNEQQRYMARMRARMGGGAAAVASGAGLTAAMTGDRPEGTLATLNGREVQWTKGNDGTWGWLPFQTEGQMAREALASSQPAVVQQSVVAPAPGLGAPAPAISPVSRARQEAANAMSQQAGGPNLSQPLVPDDAIAASKQFAAARESDPFAAVPELIDQRSQAYEQRADIQAWAKANPELAKRLFAKQRQADPGPMEASPAGLRESYGQGLGVGPGESTLEQLSYQGGIPTPQGQQLEQAFTGGVPVATEANLEGLAYRGPAPRQAPAALDPAEGLQQAFAGELEVRPQGSAQQSNLNFNNSPLPEANLTQSFTDQKKKALLEKYLPQAASFNTVWRG